MIARVKRALPRELVVQRLPPQNRASVLLTFDDGPHAEVTPGVLDRLDAHGARAVFFVVGRRIKRAPNVLSEIVERGHVVGNHTYLHRTNGADGWYRPTQLGKYYRDTRRCQSLIEPYARRGPRLFRPPGGRLTPVTLLVPKLLGLRCVTWTVHVPDWLFRTRSEARAGAVQLLSLLRPGHIVLLHDDNPTMLDLLDVLLPELTTRGWDLASGVDTLLR